MSVSLLHVLGASVWFGTAATLPFWGNRMNRATHLQVVLDIIETVYLLKCLLIMGGLTLTLVTGVILTQQMGWPFFDFSGPMFWLAVSQTLAVIIAFNSCVLLYLMTWGRAGRRSHFRYVPAIGYNNVALIAMVMTQMVMKPALEEEWLLLFTPLAMLLLADALYVAFRLVTIRKLRNMSAKEFASYYFDLLREEKMTDFFRLFRDDIVFNDPFATGPIRGIKALERFFQELGDQFHDIDITPVRVEGDGKEIRIQWEARGVTKNGIVMSPLNGTNVMQRVRGKIKNIDIDFDLSKLPPIQRVVAP